MKQITVVVCLFMASCLQHSNEPYAGDFAKQCVLPVTLAVSDDTPDTIKEQIGSSAAYWNHALGHDIFKVAKVGAVKVSVAPELYRTRSNLSNKTYPCGRLSLKIKSDGCMRNSRIDINFRCAANPDLLQTILRHELGHALGLEDTNNFGDIMCGQIEISGRHPKQITRTELLLVKQIYNLE